MSSIVVLDSHAFAITGESRTGGIVKVEKTPAWDQVPVEIIHSGGCTQTDRVIGAQLIELLQKYT
jgi:phage terminase large subunit-like protein